MKQSHCVFLYIYKSTICIHMYVVLRTLDTYFPIIQGYGKKLCAQAFA